MACWTVVGSWTLVEEGGVVIATSPYRFGGLTTRPKRVRLASSAAVNLGCKGGGPEVPRGLTSRVGVGVRCDGDWSDVWKDGVPEVDDRVEPGADVR